MEDTKTRPPKPPSSFTEVMQLRRAWLGEAEYARQQALLRDPTTRRAERRPAETPVPRKAPQD